MKPEPNAANLEDLNCLLVERLKKLTTIETQYVEQVKVLLSHRLDILARKTPEITGILLAMDGSCFRGEGLLSCTFDQERDYLRAKRQTSPGIIPVEVWSLLHDYRLMGATPVGWGEEEVNAMDWIVTLDNNVNDRDGLDDLEVP
jgi:hypothetical protein